MSRINWPDSISPFPRRSKQQFNRLKFSEVFKSVDEFKSVFPDVVYQLDENGKPITDKDGNKLVKAGSMKYIADEYWPQLSIYLEDFYLNVKHELNNNGEDKGIKKGKAMCYMALQKYQIQWQRLTDLANVKNDKFFGNDTTTHTENNSHNDNLSNNDAFIYNQTKLTDEDGNPTTDENGNTVKTDKFKDSGDLSKVTSNGKASADITTSNIKYNVDQLNELLDTSEDPDAWVIDRLIHFIASPYQPDEKDIDLYE